MKKRLLLLVLVVIMVLGLSALSGASEITPFASDYIQTYSTNLVAAGNGQMAASFYVSSGAGRMTSIGATVIMIEERVGSSYVHHRTFYSSGNPEFLTTNSSSHSGQILFNATPGRAYRVTTTVYSGDNKGYDTKQCQSGTITCK